MAFYPKYSIKKYVSRSLHKNNTRPQTPLKSEDNITNEEIDAIKQ